MRKNLKRLLICSLLAAIIGGSNVIRDSRDLKSNLIRFHVVAHSDSDADQRIKIRVRDAVLESVEKELHNLTNVDDAMKYLQDALPKLQLLVDQTLVELGYLGGSTVSLCKERFDIRQYDTFVLPAGVYNALRIVIGDGAGQNWWCVSFPTLCIPATTSGFVDAAVCAGFSESLIQMISGNDAYEIRFFFLNQLGKLENILFKE